MEVIFEAGIEAVGAGGGVGEHSSFQTSSSCFRVRMSVRPLCLLFVPRNKYLSTVLRILTLLKLTFA